MSAGDVVTVNKEGVTIALRTLQLGLRQRDSLLRQIGNAQLKSIFTTFSGQGSPAGSWVPLSPATVARNPKKYGSGHKLLIDKGILRNGFAVTVTATGVVLSNNVKYAAVQNNGSRDLVAPATGIGPSNRDSSQAAKVKSHVRTVTLAPRYELAEVEGRDGLTYRVPRAVYKEKVTMRDKNGRERTVTRMIADPGKTKTSKVGAHSRHQNIPARPFAVFRPEDPARIEKQVLQFVETTKAKAGLAGA